MYSFSFLFFTAHVIFLPSGKHYVAALFMFLPLSIIGSLCLKFYNLDRMYIRDAEFIGVFYVKRHLWPEHNSRKPFCLAYKNVAPQITKDEGWNGAYVYHSNHWLCLFMSKAWPEVSEAQWVCSHCSDNLFFSVITGSSSVYKMAAYCQY